MLQRFLRYISNLIIKFIKKDVSDTEIQSKRYLTGALFSAITVLARDIADEVTVDSEITVTGDSGRAKYLNSQVQEFMADLQFAVQRMAGTGGVLLKPYVTSLTNKVGIDILPQTRFIPDVIIGNTATSGHFLADTTIYNNKEYYRAEYHKIDLDTKLYSIENYAFDENNVKVDIARIPDWQTIPPMQYITGVEKILFGFLRSPADDKKDVKGWYGVPLDFGSEDLEGLIQGQLKRLDTEFDNKEGWIGVDERLFGKDGKIPSTENKVFKKLMVGSEKTDVFWEEFSPDIRDSSLINGLMNYMSLYEKSVGVSPGFFAEVKGRSYVNTDEIRYMQRLTFNTVDKIRKSVEAAINDLIYAVDIMANTNNLAPLGTYEIDYNWDYSMRESSTERWQQLKDGLHEGVNDKAELRAWSENEDMQTARERIIDIIPLSEVSAGIYSHEQYIASKEGITVEQARAKMPSDDDLLKESGDADNG